LDSFRKLGSIIISALTLCLWRA